MSDDKIEQLEIALRVADHTGEVVDLKQTQIAMVILNAFLLEFGTLFRGELVVFPALHCSRRPLLMISQERFATLRPRAIRSPDHLHLQHAEIDPQLQLLPTIEPNNLAHFDCTRFVRPIPEESVQIQIHRR